MGYGPGSGFAGQGGLWLNRNGVDIVAGYSQINGALSGTASTLSVHATLKLNKGDTISIHHVFGTIYSRSYSDSHFTGSLIEEDFVIS